jgi:tetratricopeptide (TPR) repeat protein
MRDLTFFVLKAWIFLPVIFLASALPAQEPGFDLQKVLQTGSVEGFRAEVTAYIAKNKDKPLAMYLDALSQSNASKAVEKYKQLLARHPNSEYADRAVIKIAQYYFSRGLYVAARKHFLELIETYPSSPMIAEAMYFAAACLYASGNIESSYTEYKNVINQYPDSPFARLAKEELQEGSFNGKDAHGLSNVNLANAKGKFAIQIGAFTQVNNALNLKNYCLKLGLPVEIREKKENNATQYLVWVGAFETREAAENFGNTFKKEHGKLFRVVER